MRDKLYAHTDKDSKIHMVGISISFPQVQAIFDVIEEIIREIYSTVYESGIILNSLGFENSKFDILKTLADSRAKAIQPMVDLLKELENRPK